MSTIGLKKISGDWTFTTESKERLKQSLEILFDIRGVKEVNFYACNNDGEDFATEKAIFSVFAGTAPGEAKPLEGKLINVGNAYAMTKYVLDKSLNDDWEIVNDQSGELLAHVNIKNNEIYIPYSLDAIGAEDVVDIVAHVVKYAKEEIFDEIQNKDSWTRSKQKDKLKERIETYLKRGDEQRISQTENHLEQVRRENQDLQRRLKSSYDNLTRDMRELELMRSTSTHGLEAFMKGLDHIAEHAKVEDVNVLQNVVTIKTTPLEISARVNGRIKKYKLGRATITIDIDSSVVKFDSEEKHKGYWTERDPHPHVSGSGGTACLGNVANTIAQLASDREIYALYLICLDFLENANTDDSAGAKVVNWEEV